jgi:hypothetical protein
MMKYIGKILKISLFGMLSMLPMNGCENPPWDSGMSLVLKVDTPDDGAISTVPTITVSGRVTGTQSAGAKVKVNEMDVPVSEGKYSASVTLNEGANVINVSATSGVASLKEQVTVTYTPAKQ